MGIIPRLSKARVKCSVDTLALATEKFIIGSAWDPEYDALEGAQTVVQAEGSAVVYVPLSMDDGAAAQLLGTSAAGEVVVGAEDPLIVALDGSSAGEAVVIPRGEVADDQQGSVVVPRILADKADDVRLGKVAVDPLEDLAVFRVGVEHRESLVYRDKTPHGHHDVAVTGIVREVPVEAPVIVPFVYLSKVLTHEQQLLAGVGELQGVQRLSAAEAVKMAAGLFAVYRLLSGANVVVREHEDEVLGEGVVGGVGENMVEVAAIVEFMREVRQGIVHPAEVPLEGKAQAALVYVLGDALLDGRILGKYICARPAGDLAAQLLQKVLALEVDVTAVDVGSVMRTAEIGVKHSLYRVDAQGVDVEFIYPVERA